MTRFNMLNVGAELPEMLKGPFNTGHIVRWSAAIENWHPLHYDHRHAVEREGLPDVLVNGSFKQQVLLQFVGDWLGDEGWLLKFSIRYRRMTIPGDTLAAWGRVAALREQAGFGVAELELGLRDQNGVETTEATATLVMPLSGQVVLPYPFDPAALGHYPQAGA